MVGLGEFERYRIFYRPSPRSDSECKLREKGHIDMRLESLRIRDLRNWRDGEIRGNDAIEK